MTPIKPASAGKRLTVCCPGGGNLNPVSGGGTYLEESTLCSAAVHAGVITADIGGSVEVEFLPGQSSCAGSSCNGVASCACGPAAGSFVIVVGGN